VYRDAVLEAMREKGVSAEKMKNFYLGFNGYVAGILPRFDQFQIFVASRSQDGLWVHKVLLLTFAATNNPSAGV
jgi:hypothetical protein